MMMFDHEGGFKLSNQKKDFSDELILAPDQQFVSPLFPNSWIKFMNLVKEYGFERKRCSTHLGGSKFIRKEFKESEKLYLIQKRISLTTTRPAKKLKIKE